MADAERYQHYEVLRREDGSLWELGRGAMGITYKAFDTNLRCLVALKVINNAYLNSELARQRFLREARAAASLRHQNVASVFHLGTDHESYFYAMEFIDGETVDAYIKRKGSLDPAEALGITLQVSRALAAADKEQLVHRDLKPSNLMLVEEDDEKVVKVIDFGLAKSTQRGGESSGTLTVGGGFVGTPHFASPEQLEERDIDIRSDIYSLGATLYYMLAGRPPYFGSLAQIMSQHLYKPVPLQPLDGFPPCVVELILRMMEKDPAKRPQRPGDLRREILPCLGRLRPDPTGVSSFATTALGKQPDQLATLDLSAPQPGAEESGTLIAQRYRIIALLGDVPYGRRFLADDRRRARKVSLLLLSPEFISDDKRYTALEREVDRLHRAPNPWLRQVYSVESAAQQSFLVEEHVIGPSLLDVLRARGFLSPPETGLLLNLLAPVADHAHSSELQQVDFTLSGVQLTSPRLTESWTESDLLRQPLTRWDQLGVKVAAVDFALSAGDGATWFGAATLTQPVSGGGPRASYLRMLSLLVYELLGGPRSTVETTGRYSPIASLSERGNALLRRGLIDDFRSATELALQLGSEIVARNVDPVAIMPVAAGSAGSSAPKWPSEAAVPPSQIAPPIGYAGQSPPQASSTPEKTRHSATRLLLVLVLAAGIGLGGYFVYQLFRGPPVGTHVEPSTAEVRLSTPPVASSNSPREVGAVPSIESSSRDAATRASSIAGGATNREVMATPSVATGREVAASPTSAAGVESSRENTAAAGVASSQGVPPDSKFAASATPNREAIAAPRIETDAAPRQEVLAGPTTAPSAPPPTREVVAASGVEAGAAPSQEVVPSPTTAPSAAPTREAVATSGGEAGAAPSQEVLASPTTAPSAPPTREAVAMPSAATGDAPSQEAAEIPTTAPSAAPTREAVATSGGEAGAAPSQEALASPTTTPRATPAQEAIAAPGGETVAAPSQETLATPTATPSAPPTRGAIAAPGGETVAAPSQETLATPTATPSAPPAREAIATPGVEAVATPSREAHPSPSPEAVKLAKREPLAVPENEPSGPRGQPMKSPSAPDDYPEQLAAAQRLIDGNDWPAALNTFLELVERYPERPAARQSLQNLLADLNTNEPTLDSESFARMKPDLVRAAEEGFLPAMLMVARSSQETDRATALKWYQAAASKESVEAMKRAGDLLYSNHKRPDDDLKALNYFTQAANTGDPEAEYLVGECYFFGKGTVPDINRAVPFLQQAVAQRYVKAMDLLGTCYRKLGKFELARRSYEEAAAAGYAISFFNLGVLYINGEGVPRNPKKAEDQFKRSAQLSKQGAERGDVVSMFYYANWLEQGIGVPKDTKAASEWYSRSARAGYPPAIDWCKRNGIAP
jgi:serine/threonine protein kinase/TPR repeat protein